MFAVEREAFRVTIPQIYIDVSVLFSVPKRGVRQKSRIQTQTQVIEF